MALRDKGRVDEAIAEWKKVIELDPKNARAHHDLGNALKARGELDGPSPPSKKSSAPAGFRRGAFRAGFRPR